MTPQRAHPLHRLAAAVGTTVAAAFAASALLLPPALHAQTAPAKPAVTKPATKPAAKPPAPVKKPPAATAAAAGPATGNDATKSLGTGSGAGMSILTRDELRACFDQRDSLDARLRSFEGTRAPLDAERTQLNTDREVITASRADFDKALQTVEALNARYKSFGDRLEAFNTKVAEFNQTSQTRSGPSIDRQRKLLKDEELAFASERKALDGDKTGLVESAEATRAAYNARVTALETRVGDWNRRNAEWNDTQKKLEAERGEWVVNCADRRYRETDEIIIKKQRGGD